MPNKFKTKENFRISLDCTNGEITHWTIKEYDSESREYITVKTGTGDSLDIAYQEAKKEFLNIAFNEEEYKEYLVEKNRLMDVFKSTGDIEDYKTYKNYMGEI